MVSLFLIKRVLIETKLCRMDLFLSISTTLFGIVLQRSLMGVEAEEDTIPQILTIPNEQTAYLSIQMARSGLHTDLIRFFYGYASFYAVLASSGSLIRFGFRAHKSRRRKNSDEPTSTLLKTSRTSRHFQLLCSATEVSTLIPSGWTMTQVCFVSLHYLHGRPQLVL